MPAAEGRNSAGHGGVWLVMRRLLIIGLAALGSFAAVLAGLPAAGAEEPGISLWRGQFEPPDCTAGRMFAVQWRVRGAADAVVDGVAREGESGEAVIDCGPAPAGWELWAARYGFVPSREVVATARAAGGELLTASLSVPMRAPAPPPAIASVRARAYGGSASVRFADDLHLRNDRTRLLIRWRAAGGGWRGGMARTDPVHARLPLEREPPVAWIGGYTTPPGRYEFQAAYGEIWAPPHVQVTLTEDFEWGYLLHPDQIEWSDSVFITIDDDLPQFLAETTPDSITVHLADGIEVGDVRLMLVPRHWRYEDDYVYQEFFAVAADDTGAGGSVRWSGLESSADYVLSVHWRGEDRPPGSLLLDLRTESAPPGFEPAGRFSRFSATAEAERIVLEWDAPPGAEDAAYSAVAYRYGSLNAAAERSDLRGPSHRVVLDGLDPGSAYEVVVRRERGDGMAFESRLVVETDSSAEPPLPTGDSAPPVLDEPAYGWFGASGCHPEPAELRVKISDAEGWERFEYEWEIDGRLTRWRHARPRLDLSGVGRGRYAIRVRGFRDGVWSTWSDWTMFARDLQAPTGMNIVPQRLDAGIRVYWRPAPNVSPDVRFILRWSIDDGPWQERRGIADRHALIPLDPDAAGVLRAIISPSAPDVGEGEPSKLLEHRFRAAPGLEPVETPEYSPVERWMPPVEIETVAATTEGIYVAWNCLDHITSGVHNVRTSYVIRWREAGDRAWTHARGDTDYAYPHCYHKLTGLRPGASYELGVATYFSDYGAGVPNPEWLVWAGIRTAAMPAPVDDALIAREAGRVAVVWTPQPDVPRYVAVLRGGGRSWHQVVGASGAGGESATFDGLSEEAAYSAEVLLPPAVRGHERRWGPWRLPRGCE